MLDFLDENTLITERQQYSDLPPIDSKLTARINGKTYTNPVIIVLKPVDVNPWPKRILWTIVILIGIVFCLMSYLILTGSV